MGSLLLRELLADPGYRRVTAVVRKLPAERDPRVNCVIADLGDALAAALSRTRRRRRLHRHRHDQRQDARPRRGTRASTTTTSVLAARLGEGERRALPSASSRPSARTRGIIEGLVPAHQGRDGARRHRAGLRAHPHLPAVSTAGRTRGERRPLEKALDGRDAAGGNPLLAGRLSIYRGVAAAVVARALRAAAGARSRKLAIHHWREIETLARRAPPG